jgi:hypothetical protein
MSDLSTPIIVVLILVFVILLIFVGRRLNWFTSTVAPQDAQKYARLLVAEIKLYNEVKLENACRNGTVYQQLQSEIDRARQDYDRRVAADSTGGRDYFHEELVNILADGDATKMGPGYSRYLM